jgi:hypothetical protein
MTQRERLLFLQGNRCFFCDEAIPEGEATVEHLVATANGGPNQEHNCVVCCRTLNSLLGCLPLKEKLRAILRHRGRFTCPGRMEGAAATNGAATQAPRVASAPPTNGAANMVHAVSTLTAPPRAAAPPTDGATVAPGVIAASPTDTERFELALTHLQKQRKVLPRRLETLRSSLRTTTLGRLTEAELDAVIAALTRRGFVRFAADQVIYRLPPVG